MPTTGPVHAPPKPILLYWFNDVLSPTDPNQWVPWSATAGPAINSHNQIWDGAAWVNMYGSSDGRQAINLERVNGTTQTADNWSARLQALNDESVPGVSQAIGLPAGVPTDATADNTMRRFLELILAALGGTLNQHYEVLTFVAPGGGGFSAPQSFTQAVEYIKVIDRNAPADVEVSDAVGVFPGAPDYLPYFRNSQGVEPLNCLSVQIRNFGGVAGPPNATVYVIGYRN